MKAAFILCTRYGSSRVPGKAFRKINGVPVVEHLIDRIKKTNIQVILAVPESDLDRYSYLRSKGVDIFTGYENDPLARTYHAAREFGIDTIIRVTHDKIFIEPRLVLSALNEFVKTGVEYLYSTDFTDGSAFEIMSFDSVTKATLKYKNVEFISYAIKSVASKCLNFDISDIYKSNHRLLLDYDQDMVMMEAVLKQNGNDCTLHQAIKFLDKCRWAKNINKLPIISIYTCGYNAVKHLSRCISSVVEQDIFKSCEYILIDDFSKDDTFIKMIKETYRHQNIRVVRNSENMGLSSSSNIALKLAKGKFIIRLDADDFFVNKNSLSHLLNKIIDDKKDVIYPDNYFGDFKTIQKGSECHHVGGALFRTKAINHIKFTEKLRGFEGLDFFKRSSGQVEVGYLDKPVFFYRQHEKSMSKTNKEYRDLIKKNIEDGVLGDRLT